MCKNKRVKYSKPEGSEDKDREIAAIAQGVHIEELTPYQHFVL